MTFVLLAPLETVVLQALVVQQLSHNHYQHGSVASLAKVTVAMGGCGSSNSSSSS